MINNNDKSVIIIFLIVYSSGKAGGCGKALQAQFSHTCPDAHSELSQLSPDSITLLPQTAGSVQLTKNIATTSKLIINNILFIF